MKHFIKYPFTLCALLSATAVVQNPAHALRCIVFDPFFERQFDELIDFAQQQEQIFIKQGAEYGTSKEDREALKEARERLAKVKHTIREDAQTVTIQFTGLEGINKKNIEVEELEDGTLSGTITVKDGKLLFRIHRNALQIARKVEILKEDQDKKERVTSTSSLPSDLEYFKGLVILNKVDVQPFKDNTLTIVLQKQQKKLIAIP